MQTKNYIKVWDLPIRIFHWLLVAGFFTAYFTEDDLLPVHVGAGYLIIALLIFRLVWGFAGNRYARFSGFLCSPARSIAYVRELISRKAKRYIGHNPAGAAMILLLLLNLALTCASGLAVYGADQGAGPWPLSATAMKNYGKKFMSFLPMSPCRWWVCMCWAFCWKVICTVKICSKPCGRERKNPAMIRIGRKPFHPTES